MVHDVAADQNNSAHDNVIFRLFQYLQYSSQFYLAEFDKSVSLKINKENACHNLYAQILLEG